MAGVLQGARGCLTPPRQALMPPLATGSPTETPTPRRRHKTERRIRKRISLIEQDRTANSEMYFPHRTRRPKFNGEFGNVFPSSYFPRWPKRHQLPHPPPAVAPRPRPACFRSWCCPRVWCGVWRSARVRRLTRLVSGCDALGARVRGSGVCARSTPFSRPWRARSVWHGCCVGCLLRALSGRGRCVRRVAVCVAFVGARPRAARAAAPARDDPRAGLRLRVVEGRILVTEFVPLPDGSRSPALACGQVRVRWRAGGGRPVTPAPRRQIGVDDVVMEVRSARLRGGCAGV